MNDKYSNPPSDVGENKPPSTADLAGTGEQKHETNTPSMLRNTGASGTGRPTMAPLLTTQDTQSFRDRWNSVQTDFVDEPRHAVEQADSLVAELMQQLAKTFSTEKNKLEGEWSRGQDVSTEDLRVALQRYRSFFDRLLSL